LLIFFPQAFLNIIEINMSENKNVLHEVKVVKQAYEKEANELLEQGWILLSVESGQEQRGPHDYSPVFKYCLGKIK
jgi:hypothetical protein